MEKEPEVTPEEQAQPAGEQPEPPPFDPDARLVTYLEKGSKLDAERRFKADMEKRAADRRG